MLRDQAVEQMKTMRHFFNNTISCFTEKDAGFAPKPEMYTVAQHIFHVGDTVTWFISGAFSPAGFNLEFEAQIAQAKKIKSLAEAKAHFDTEVEKAIKAVSKKSDQELAAALPAGPIMGGLPVMAIFPALTDHSAHHRGSLAVYARLTGKVPKMPYGD